MAKKPKTPAPNKDQADKPAPEKSKSNPADKPLTEDEY